MFQVIFVVGILTGISLCIAGIVLRRTNRNGDLGVLVYIGKSPTCYLLSFLHNYFPKCHVTLNEHKHNAISMVYSILRKILRLNDTFQSDRTTKGPHMYSITMTSEWKDETLIKESVSELVFLTITQNAVRWTK